MRDVLTNKTPHIIEAYPLIDVGELCTLIYLLVSFLRSLDIRKRICI